MDLELQSFPEQSMDLISSLPNEILSHILSFCSTKDAAKTSILSRSWRFTWISIPNLEFDEPYTREYSAADAKLFTESVSRVLHRRDEAVNRFFLRVHNPYMCSKDMNELIPAALRRNVEEFKLECHSCDVQFPGNLYCCRNLKNLQLQGSIRLSVPQSACFPNLKVLALLNLSDLDDGSIERIISFSPCLEELSISISRAKNAKNLAIKSSSLRCLEIIKEDRDCDYFRVGHDAYTVTIHTPNLEFLHFRDYGFDDYSISALPSLAKAFISITLNLRVMQDNADRLYHILSQISSVKDLTLTDLTMVSLGVFDRFLEDFPYFHNLTNLKIEVFGSHWLLMLQILKHAPSLKNFIHVCGDDFVKELATLSLEDNVCLLTSLERLEMHNFKGNADEMKFMEYMFKYGTSLHTVVIKWNARHDIDELDIVTKLLAYPRAQRTCQISCSRMNFLVS